MKIQTKKLQDRVNHLKKQVKSLKEQFIPEYLQLSAEWIEQRANEILDASDIGANVKEYIKNGWLIDRISDTHIVLYNISKKSAYVEFGVGIVGQGEKHPNANNTGWEYNVKTQSKDAQGGWLFGITEASELDIPRSAIIEQEYIDDELAIYTKGTKGVWYLFNAVEDFKMQRQKPLFEELKKKYLG